MSKKIVVITGSPRKNGNSFAMTQAFIDGAEKLGHEVVRFDAALLNLDGCRACKTCFKTGKACSFDDDFNRIAPEIQEADAVVFTMPVYWYGMPGKVKHVLDKMYSFFIAGKDIAGKECGLISCCEDTDLTTFNGVRFAYEKSAQLLEWKNVGEVLITEVNEEGNIEKTDGCKKAEELAALF